MPNIIKVDCMVTMRPSASQVSTGPQFDQNGLNEHLCEGKCEGDEQDKDIATLKRKIPELKSLDKATIISRLKSDKFLLRAMAIN